MVVTMKKYTPNDEVDILVLGAGWTSKFLVQEFRTQNLTYALTTTTGDVHKSCEGKYNTSSIIAFRFDPDSDDESNYHDLPGARTVIVTFPLKGVGQAKKLVETYQKIHAGVMPINWIALGSTSIWPEKKLYRSSDLGEYNKTNARAIAEDEFIELGGVVLNLAGLWGDERVPWNWPYKLGVARSKEKLKEKASLHLIHGTDVAQACVAVSKHFHPAERWPLTDMEVYDWWDLIDGWGDYLETEAEKDGQMLPYRKWVDELLKEAGLNELPRSPQVLGRCLDGSAFWKEHRIKPRRTLSRDLKKNWPEFSFGSQI